MAATRRWVISAGGAHPGHPSDLAVEEPLEAAAEEERVVEGEQRHAAQAGLADAWEKRVLSARGFKRVGRRSKYAI
jgi:hypothetical protein